MNILLHYGNLLIIPSIHKSESKDFIMNISQHLLSEMPDKLLCTSQLKKIYEAELASTLTRGEKITRFLLTGPLSKITGTLMAVDMLIKLTSQKYRQKLISKNNDGTIGIYKDTSGEVYVSLATAAYLESRTEKYEKLYPKNLTTKFNAASLVAIKEASDYTPQKKAGFIFEMR